MRVTEVWVQLVEDRNGKVKAFCSITFDNAFVVRDLKIIEIEDGSGDNKRLFVAMPSRKLSAKCGRCGHKNHVEAHYCNYCACQLPEGRKFVNKYGQVKIHADVAHPITQEYRQIIQDAVLAEYYKELELSKNPDYKTKHCNSSSFRED